MHPARSARCAPRRIRRLVGVDRGLSAFWSPPRDGEEVTVAGDAPKSSARGDGSPAARRNRCRASERISSPPGRHQTGAEPSPHTNVRRISAPGFQSLSDPTGCDQTSDGMLRNHRLAQAISDAGWAEFARLLRYKQAWRGGDVLVADR